MAQAPQKAKKGRKNRKIGRNVRYMQRYQAEHRFAKNKVKKLDRHLKRFPMDKKASEIRTLYRNTY